MTKSFDYLIVGAALFGGRLAEYKYYDMAPVIRKAMEMYKERGEA